MADENKLLSDRIENSDEPERGFNWPMIGGIAALIGFVGIGVWINGGDSEADERASIIPEVTETPDPRSQGGTLFGTVPTEPLPEVTPQEDPRVAQLVAELAELREALNAAQSQEPTVEVNVESLSPESPAPALDATAVAELISQQQKAALEPLLKKLEDDRLASERRQRELIARLQANRPITEPGQVAPVQPNPDVDAQRIEAERIEAERLAEPLVNTLGRGVDASGGADNAANNSTANEFLDAAAARSVETARAEQLADAHRLVPQGRTIPAILETAISSDLPGQLRARVSRDVWSADATTILIPRGSTLVGEYSSDISLGQRRVLVAWNRVITTDQRSVLIGSRGVDALGRAGLTGNVQHHFGLKFEAAFFISIFSGISSFGNRAINDNELTTGTDGFADAGQSAFEEYLSIPPTISINQGEQINVFVSRDLYL